MKKKSKISKSVLDWKVILSIIVIILLTCLMIVTVDDKSVEPPNRDNVQLINNKELSIEDILLQYNEEGMVLLRAIYPNKEDMTLGLKNIGNEISNLTLKDINNKTVELKLFKGKKIIYEIVQDSCNSCLENTPIITNALKQDNNDIMVVPIFLNSSVDGIKKYYSKLNLDLPEHILLDENKDIAKEFNLTKTPSTIFVDENNRVSLIKEEVYDKNTIADDLKLAFENNKIYNMKVNLTTGKN